MGVFFAQAIPTQAGEAEAAGVYLAAGDLSGLGRQSLGYLHLMQVDNTVTVPTDEMYMGVDISVEPVNALDSGHTLHQTVLPEFCKIPVHRGHAQIRNGLLQIRVDGFGGRVGIGTAQVLQNGVTLAEIF